MQDEHGRFGRGGIDLLQSRHAALGELELGPAADYPDPLRRRGPRRLLLQQAQGVRQRRHAVPTQFEVVVKAAADRVHVRIVEAGNDRPALRVNHHRRRPALPQNLVIGTGGIDLAVLDGDGFHKRRDTIRGNLGVMQDDLGRHGGLLYLAFI